MGSPHWHVRNTLATGCACIALIGRLKVQEKKRYDAADFGRLSLASGEEEKRFLPVERIGSFKDDCALTAKGKPRSRGSRSVAV